MTIAVQPAILAGIGDVADRYDAFFIDQFGVLHDGTQPYPGARQALSALHRAGKRVVLLSNSGKRSAPNVARLERLGFSADMWTQLLSSGEVARSALAKDLADGTIRRRCLLIARDGDRSAIEGLPVDVVADAAACDFVLIAGSEGDVVPLDTYRVELAPAAARGVPAYCTNPDMQMLTPSGLRFGAGQIATLYEEMGGAVQWIGKPFPAIYAVARRAVGDIAPGRILCIGDSIDHDIVGATGAGLASCLIGSGIHAGAAPAALSALFDQAGATPDFMMGHFQW